jgi:hypothetical protein
MTDLAIKDAYTIGCALARRGIHRNRITKSMLALKTRAERDAFLAGYYAIRTLLKLLEKRAIAFRLRRVR